MVVDDEQDVTDSLKEGLERRGYVVDTFNDPTLVLSGIGDKQYDLAIFDIRMPEMSGFELYKRFREVDGITKVCFFTAFDVYEDEFKRLFPDVKVETFLKKPMPFPRLAQKVEEILAASVSVVSRG